jgi:hypothetical protein
VLQCLRSECAAAVFCLLQVAALEELLGFLAGVGPFRGLSRELLTSLAVYVRPVRVGQGELLAVAGDKANTLLIIQVSLLFSRQAAVYYRYFFWQSSGILARLSKPQPYFTKYPRGNGATCSHTHPTTLSLSRGAVTRSCR